MSVYMLRSVTRLQGALIMSSDLLELHKGTSQPIPNRPSLPPGVPRSRFQDNHVRCSLHQSTLWPTFCYLYRKVARLYPGDFRGDELEIQSKQSKYLLQAFDAAVVSKLEYVFVSLAVGMYTSTREHHRR